MSDMHPSFWFAAGALIGGIVGFALGQDRAMRQCAQLLELLRLETETYLQVLMRKDEPPL